MKIVSLPAALGAIALLFFCSGPLFAQGAVFNGDFEIGSYSPMWTLTGNNVNTEVVIWETKPGNLSYSLKRRPGSPNGNGGFEQSVALQGGVKYVFSADVTSRFGPC